MSTTTKLSKQLPLSFWEGQETNKNTHRPCNRTNLWRHVYSEGRPFVIQALQNTLGHWCFTSAHWPSEQHRVPTHHQSFDQEIIAHCVHCWNHYLVERSTAARDKDIYCTLQMLRVGYIIYYLLSSQIENRKKINIKCPGSWDCLSGFLPGVVAPAFWQLIFKGSPAFVLGVHKVFINGVLWKSI